LLVSGEAALLGMSRPSARRLLSLGRDGFDSFSELRILGAGLRGGTASETSWMYGETAGYPEKKRGTTPLKE
jgi:hypothetical protein